MTVAPESVQVGATGMPAAIAALRAHRLRISAARRVVLEALFAAGGPATADELAAGIPGFVPESDLASMYRNLETLEEVGIVRHVHFGHGPGRYVLSEAADRGYVYCQRCGAFEQLPAGTLAALRDVVRRGTSYEPRFTHFPVGGVCEACRAA
jgi:Fur family transcriptional regulator, ferric uptake regulator